MNANRKLVSQNAIKLRNYFFLVAKPVHFLYTGCLMNYDVMSLLFGHAYYVDPNRPILMVLEYMILMDPNTDHGSVR